MGWALLLAHVHKIMRFTLLKIHGIGTCMYTSKDYTIYHGEQESSRIQPPYSIRFERDI